jgi:hypothetical protein
MKITSIGLKMCEINVKNQIEKLMHTDHMEIFVLIINFIYI